MLSNIPVLHGQDIENGRYRFIVDDRHKKIRMFKKVKDELIPMTVWTFEQLIEAMVSHGD
jgi:hypothetical protein